MGALSQFIPSAPATNTGITPGNNGGGLSQFLPGNKISSNIQQVTPTVTQPNQNVKAAAAPLSTPKPTDTGLFGKVSDYLGGVVKNVENNSMVKGFENTVKDIGNNIKLTLTPQTILSPVPTPQEPSLIDKVKTEASKLNDIVGPYLFKVYTPLEYRNPEDIFNVDPNVKQTAGKAIGGALNDILTATMLSEGQLIRGTRDVATEGLNLMGAIKTGALFSATTGLINMLQEKEVKLSDLLISGGFGAIIGAHNPQLMDVPKSVIDGAKSTLSEFGFKNSDFNKPDVLRSKFNEIVMNLHPDKGGDPEQFKSFIDAYNKVTSAGIDPNWKPTDIKSWSDALWSKAGTMTDKLYTTASQKFQDFVRKVVANGENAPKDITKALPSGEYTPQQVIDTVMQSKLDKTPEGQQTIKTALEAQDKGLNINVNNNFTPLKGALTPVDTHQILQARNMAREIPETININTPERKQLQQNIANKLYGTGAIKKERRADLVLGTPASGKSTQLVNPLVNEHGALLLDSDQAKELLPEFNNGIGAAATHKESSLISDGLILDKALDNGDNIVWSRVGTNVEEYKRLIELLKANGYNVHVHLLELPAHEAASRAIERYSTTGRFVDPDYIINVVDSSPVKVYNAIKNHKGVHTYEKHSNQVPRGQKPKLIERGENKQTESSGRELQQQDSNRNLGKTLDKETISKIKKAKNNIAEATKLLKNSKTASDKARWTKYIKEVNQWIDKKITKATPTLTKEIINGDLVVEKLKKMGTNGGLKGDGASWLISEIKKENYKKEVAKIDDLLKNDLTLKEYIDGTKGKLRSHTGREILIPPIVTLKGSVLDGFNRIAKAIKNGEKEIEVLKGIAKTTPPLSPTGTEGAIQAQSGALANIKSGRVGEGVKSLTNADIIKKDPVINLKRDITITDIYGKKHQVTEDEALTPYELKGNKIVLKDGGTYIVSKSQFEFVKQNAVKSEAKEFAPELKGTEEKMLGGKDFKKRIAEIEKIFKDKGFNIEQDMSGEVAVTDKNEEFVDPEDLEKTNPELHKLAIEYGSMNIKDEPGSKLAKYSQYTLPGGENYREVLIKSPFEVVENKPLNWVETKPGQWEAVYGNGERIFGILKEKGGYYVYEDGGVLGQLSKTMEWAKEKAQAAVTKFARADFISSHWDGEPNILAHLRINDRVTPDGKKVTFVEEIQSDWNKEGRDKGFVNPEREKMVEEYTKLDDEFKKEFGRDWWGKTKDLDPVKLKRWEDLTKQLDEMPDSKTRNNPLLKNWQTMTVKRALQEAVKDGSDYMAWVNGEQTSARYNLAKEIKDVSWKNKDGNKSVILSPKTGSEIRFSINSDGIIEKDKTASFDVPDMLKGKKLDEAIGKGLADKIMGEEEGTLSGEGLKFGGEWANTLYDKQIKNIVQDLTGQKVEMLDLKLPIENKNTIWYTTEKSGDYRGGSVTKGQLTKENIKEGELIKNSDGDYFIINKVLTDGKFEAVKKEHYSRDYWESEIFDLNGKQSPGQQAIKITPEIARIVKGEAPVLKQPSGELPFKETQKEVEKPKYERGAITKFSKALDELLQTESYNINGSWKNNDLARNTAYAEIEAAADEGVPEAIDQLKKVNELYQKIADQRALKYNLPISSYTFKGTELNDNLFLTNQEGFIDPAAIVADLQESMRKYNQEQEDKEFGTALRTYFVGERDVRVAQTNQIILDFEKKVKKPLDQEALTIIRDFKNREGELDQLLDGTHEYYDLAVERFKKENKEATEKEIKQFSSDILDRGKALYKIIDRALHPSNEMLEVDKTMTEYFKTKLEEGQKLGFLESNISPESYINHLLQPKEEGEPTKKAFLPKRNKIGRYFQYAKSRAYKDVIEAYINGVSPRTLNAVHAMAIYGERYATAAATRLLIQNLKDTELGKWGSSKSSNIPSDWRPISPESNLFRNEVPYIKEAMFDKLNDDQKAQWEKEVAKGFAKKLEDRYQKAEIAHQLLFAPEKVVLAMQPLTDPSYLNRVPLFMPTRVYQAYIKAAELGLSVFHMKALSFTALNNEGALPFLKGIYASMDSPLFKQQEQNLIRAGGTSSILGKTVEIYHGMKVATNPSYSDLLQQAPGMKQVDGLARYLTHVTFEVLQRKIKVTDFATKDAAWMAKNPTASQTEHYHAQRGIAKQINATYGGLQWEVLGWNKLTLELAKMVLLAPDWTFSNFFNIKQSFEGGPGGKASRRFWASSIIAGVIATYLMSLLLSGKPTKNPTKVYLGNDDKGKEIYQNMFFVGAPGDLVNLIMNIQEYGPIQGFAQSLASKTGPIIKVATQFLTNRNWLGQEIVPKGSGLITGTIRSAEELAQGLMPIPFSITNFYNMVTDAKNHYIPAEYLSIILGGTRSQHVVPEGMREVTAGKKKGQLVKVVEGLPNTSTAAMRLPQGVTDIIKAIKIQVGDNKDKNPTHYELDHIIPLSLGGDNSLSNMKVQLSDKYAPNHLGYETKDKVEAAVLAAVKKGRLTTKQAQDWMAKDWVGIGRKLGVSRATTK